jgi:uncharacterized protein DUF4129
VPRLSARAAGERGQATNGIQRLPRGVKAGAAALALVGLLALVTLAARGAHPGGHGRIAQRQVPEQVNKDLFTVVVLLYVAGVIGVFWLLFVFKNKWEPVKSHWLRDFLVLMVMLSVLAVVGEKLINTRRVQHAAQRNATQQQTGAGKNRRAKAPPNRRIPPGSAGFDWVLGGSILGLLVVAGAVVYVRARMRPLPEPLPLPEPGREELAAAVSDAIDDLRAEPDARRAVIAAYARMEGALARRGHARHLAETPFEYLSRVLLSLQVRGGAVRELTELFERAKFSTHPIDEEMKERAISALVAVREDLTPAVAA